MRRWAVGGGIGTASGVAVATARQGVPAHTPVGLWIVLITTISVSGIIALVAIVFDFILKNKAANLDRARADAEAERAKIREANYWSTIVKAAAEPASSAHYTELSDAAARYVAVEKNGIKPSDKTHGNLYGHHPPAVNENPHPSATECPDLE